MHVILTSQINLNLLSCLVEMLENLRLQCVIGAL